MEPFDDEISAIIAQLREQALSRKRKKQFRFGCQDPNYLVADAHIYFLLKGQESEETTYKYLLDLKDITSTYNSGTLFYISCHSGLLFILNQTNNKLYFRTVGQDSVAIRAMLQECACLPKKGVWKRVWEKIKNLAPASTHSERDSSIN